MRNASTLAMVTSVTATKTAVFQIRAPSAWKRAALLDAMKRTHLATHAVLAALQSDMDGWRSRSKKVERTAIMQQIAYAVLRPRALSTASAAAARVDAMGMAESYVQQLADGRERAAYPTVPPLSGRQPRYAAALDELAGTHATVEREGDLRDELTRMARAPHPRPLSLHGYGHFYKLLRHQKTGRLFAYVNVLSSESRFAPSQGEANQRAREAASDMLDIDTGELVRCKRPTWILLPLAFGHDFQERDFLLCGNPRGGRIVYRPDQDRFELHASFEYKSPAVDTGARFLGVDRGIYNLAAWCVTDADGRVIEDGTVSGIELRHVQRMLERRTRDQQRRGMRVPITTRRAQADEAVHRTANKLVAVAKRLQARMVLEELTMQRRLRTVPTGKKGGRFGRAARRILGRQQYAKLTMVLAYKLAREGLPPPIAVGAAFTSQTCLECGHVDAANRVKLKRSGNEFVDMSRFCCVRCGHAADADCNAARVIALKGAWLIQLPTLKERKGRPLTESEKWPAYMDAAAKRRGSSAKQSAVLS